MHSVTENCPVSATGLEFLPKSLCLCACIVCVCVCVCVCARACASTRMHSCSGHQYSMNMNFDRHNHVITGFQLGLLVENIPFPSCAVSRDAVLLVFFLQGFWANSGLFTEMCLLVFYVTLNMWPSEGLVLCRSVSYQISHSG